MSSKINVYDFNRSNLIKLSGQNAEEQLSYLRNAKQNTNEKNYKKDVSNIVFLMFLYLLQGVPIGLLFSLPFILSSNNASYSDQGTFSFASWPYSMKLLWAPVVDSVFSNRIGRRKSWLVPVQYMIGICMLIFSDYVHRTLETKHGGNTHREIYMLTAIFFLFTFLSATQDIAVDGWGLTILSKENLEWASICNNAGATAGILIGNSVFLVLESKDFCNDLIRPFIGLDSQNYGMVSLKQFMDFFGVLYIISTTLILLFKNEKNENYETNMDPTMTIKDTYASLWAILKLKPIQKFIFILLTCKVAFATSSIRSLKMIEKGVPKEKLGLMNAPFQIIQILTPIFFGNLANVSKPLELFLKIYPIRMIVTIMLALWVYFTPWFKDSNNEYPWIFFISYAVLNGVYSLIFSSLSLTKTMFFTQVSDKSIGGTYMTLLNTISNIGVAWPATLTLYLVDALSFKNCVANSIHDSILLDKTNKQDFNQIIIDTSNKNTCSNENEIETCIRLGAKCLVSVDAFYSLTIIATLFGATWLFYYSKTMHELQALTKSSWRVHKARKDIKKYVNL